MSVCKKPHQGIQTNGWHYQNEKGLVLRDGEKEYCSKLYIENEIVKPTPARLQNNETEPSALLKEDIKKLKNGKSSGVDKVTAKWIKHGGESVETFYQNPCAKIWNEKDYVFTYSWERRHLAMLQQHDNFTKMA